MIPTLRPYQDQLVADIRQAMREPDAEKADALRRAQNAERSRRYRERHPEKVAAAQREYDQRPERKEKQRIRAAEKRKTAEKKEWQAEYRRRPHVLAKRSAYEKTEQRKLYQAQYKSKPETKAKRATRMRAVRATSLGGLNNRMSVAVHRGLRLGKQGQTWPSVVGYNLDDLKRHLEKQFSGRMSWSNMGKWHIDHIIPLASFNFTSANDPEFKAAWALTNLRPLWASKNITKGCKREVLL